MTAKRKKRVSAPKPPKRRAAKKQPRRRRNGDELEAAAKLSEKFHGRPANRVSKVKELNREATTLTELGKAVSLVIELRDGTTKKIALSPVTKVCSDPDGGQLYLVGGDQEVDLKQFGIRDTGKHHVVLGEGVEITYQTQKSFDKFETVNYVHELGEETDERPLIGYDTLNLRLYFIDGAYEIEDVPDGEVSPGIVN